MKPDWASDAARLPPSALRRYLVAAGWVDDDENESATYWSYSRATPQGQVSVEVPKRQDFVDYDRRVAELIEILTLVEKRSARAIIFELGQPGADVLSFRYHGAETEDGTISVDDGIRIREERRRLLLSTAHSVIEPLPHHPRLSRSEPAAFIASCREAPSRIGSYLSPVLVPVSPEVGDAEVEDPFSRRVTTMLANALHIAAEALSAGDDKHLLRGAEKGLSSNFLAALSGLRPPGRGTLVIGFSWAARRRPPSLPFRSVTFDHRVFEPLGEIARVLRESSPSPGTVVEGYVASFDREATDPTQPGDVVLIATIEDRPGTPKVHMKLSQEAYAQAMLAHREARRVRVMGTLIKEGRRYVLRDPGGFGVISESED
ncbi:hypothetical protein [Paraliomyxa miuraensis]|uniref:hypothetical protein n=1 Tax=Paraliomyxa miuraensis TaxID=376150 RepID=UPI002252E281|nr:hypothetical protein [Paraliomyxa miuraensis]MCX4241638.1 hypothetical protein [Paraliomyxa miuraensis]